MSTATPTIPAAPANAAPAITPKPRIWPNGFEMPVIVVTGEFSSGKTLFGLTIDPKNTLVIDFELGSKTYEKAMGFSRIDVPAEMGKLYPRGYQPIHVFQWWWQLIRELPPEKFTVMVIDDVSSIEEGLTAWVRANPGYFGRTAVQYAKAEAMVWGDVKSLWKSILLDLAVRVQSMVLITHMRDEFIGGKPTGRREPKGKETLKELATLFVGLSRTAGPNGIVPPKPVATILKSRLAHTRMDDTGELRTQPVLTPVVPDFTPARVRHLMLNPVDYDNLKPEERVQESHVTEMERLAIQQRIAEDSRLAAEAARDRVLVETAEANRKAGAAVAGLPVNPDHSAELAALRAEKTRSAAQTEELDGRGTLDLPAPLAAPEFARTAPVAVAEIAPPTPAAVAPAVAVNSTPAATPAVAEVTPAVAEVAPPTPADDCPFDVPGETPATVPATNEHAPATREQCEQLKALKDELGIEIADWRAKLMLKFGVESATKLTFGDADGLIRELSANVAAKRESENAIPDPTATPANLATPANGRLETLASLKFELGTPDDKWAAMLTKNYQVSSAANLTAEQADNLIAGLRQLAEKRRQKKEEAKFMK